MATFQFPQEPARSPSQRVREPSDTGYHDPKSRHDRCRRHAKTNRGLGQGPGPREDQLHQPGLSGLPSSLALIFPRDQKQHRQDDPTAPQGFLTGKFREETSGLGWATSGWSMKKPPDVYAVLCCPKHPAEKQRTEGRSLPFCPHSTGLAQNLWKYLAALFNPHHKEDTAFLRRAV